MNDLIKRLRLLEQDHEPDGWPAVQMKDISTLLDMVEKEPVIGAYECVETKNNLERRHFVSVHNYENTAGRNIKCTPLYRLPTISKKETVERIACPCGDEYPIDSRDAGFIVAIGHCENCLASSKVILDSLEKNNA